MISGAISTRNALLAAPLLAALAVPAFAQAATPAPAPTEDEDIWADDPYAENDEMAIAADRLMDVILDLPIGRLARAMPEVDIEGDVRQSDTLRDYATREDPGFEERTRGGARMMAGMLGQFIANIDELAPALEAMGDRIGDAAPRDR